MRVYLPVVLLTCLQVLASLASTPVSLCEFVQNSELTLPDRLSDIGIKSDYWLDSV